MTTPTATLAATGACAPVGLRAWPFPDGSSARIAYGAERAVADPRALARLPSVLAEPGRMLRLNCEAFELPLPAPGQPSLTVEQRLADYLRQLSGGWNGSAARFVDGYMAHLRTVIAANRPAITERLGSLAGLFAPEDVLFSAPLPLPRALLPLADDDGAVPCPVDMLLWLGDAAQAVLFTPSTLTPGAERRRRERLTAAGIGLCVMGPADLARPAAFADLLGEGGRTFWRDEILPVAPGAPRLPDF